MDCDFTSRGTGQDACPTRYSRTANRERSVWTGQFIAQQLGIAGATTVPQIVGFPRCTVRDLLPLGDAASQPLIFHVNNTQWADAVRWVNGKRTDKSGLSGDPPRPIPDGSCSLR